VIVQGLAEIVVNKHLEIADYYKASQIKILQNPPNEVSNTPPFRGVPPDLELYRDRGHRRLDMKVYLSKCVPCLWGCMMPVEIIVDHWNPSNKRYRFETFCYGPKSCLFYKAGPKRKVPGRKGMSYTEEDWIDQEAVAHRGDDE